MTKDFDLVVIGGGPAGISGANTAAIFGKRVALVEKLGEVGGAGINTGTIPSKTLRETALALSGLRSRKLYGVDLSLRREATVADFTGRRVLSIPTRCGLHPIPSCAARKFLSPPVHRPCARRSFRSKIRVCTI